jgi:DNA-binding NtrC family response regulator
MATILVVDDEEPIRKMLGAALTRAGHKVQTAGNAEQAIDLCRSGCFDVILSDVVMPAMDGHQLTQTVAGLCPRTRVILMSGFDKECHVCPYEERCKVMPKPFRPAEVLDLIHGALTAPPPKLRPEFGGATD